MSSKKYAVSVIVPVYNVEKYIKECLDSLVNQTLKNIEIIVVNDGSPDNSQVIIDEYVKKYPDKVKSFIKENGGLSDARNYGVNKASGEYVAFVDSDDFIDKNMCKLMYRRAKAYDCDIVVAPYLRYAIGSFKKTSGGEMSITANVFHGREYMNRNDVMIVCNKIYRLDFIKPFPFKKNTWYEDVAWTPIVMSYAKRVSYINKKFYHYIIRENSITQSKTDVRTIQGIDSVFHSINNCNPEEKDVIEYFGFRRLLFETRMRLPYREKYVEAIKKLLPTLENNKYLMASQFYYDKFKELKKGIYIIPRNYYYANFEDSNEYNEEVIERWEHFLSCGIGKFECLGINNTKIDKDLVDKAYKEKKYKVVNDYFLLNRIYETGGVALNYNVKFEKFISECLINECFFCYDINGDIDTDIWGAVAKSPVIKDIINIFEAKLKDGYMEDDLLKISIINYFEDKRKYKLDGCTKKLDYNTSFYKNSYFYSIKSSEKKSKFKKIFKLFFKKAFKIRFIKNVSLFLLSTKKLLASKSFKRFKYAKYYEKNEIVDNLFLFESFYGRGLLSNPYALFIELTKRKDFSNKQIVWVLDKKKNHKKTIKQIKEKYSNVSFVERGTLAYYKYLSTAKYLINDVTFSFEYIKKESQIYINTWHSITVKTLGYDMPGNPLNAKNVIRNFFASDYFLSPNDFMGKEIFGQSHKMNNIYPGIVVQEGFPRDDLTHLYTRKEVINIMKEAGVSVDENKKIIVYAPTWRGDKLGRPSDDIDEYNRVLEEITKNIDSKKYQVLLRVHQLVYKHLDKRSSLLEKIVPSIIDANIMFAATDLLITDYSSIFFDYLPTGRPILFYSPDVEEYNKYRGNYFCSDDLPSHTSTTVEELCYDINHIDEITKQYKNKYQYFVKTYCGYENGKDSKRIVDGIFYNKKMNTYQMDHNKKKVLLYIKNAESIDNYAERLIRVLDTNKYDITLFVDDKHKEDYYKLLSKYLDYNVRVFGMSHSKYYSFTLSEFYLIKSLNYYKELSDKNRNIINNHFKREWTRNFGDCQFDLIINLSGDELYFNYLLLNGTKNATKIIRNAYSNNKNKRQSKVCHSIKVYGEYDKTFISFSSLLDVLIENGETLNE